MLFFRTLLFCSVFIALALTAHADADTQIIIDHPVNDYIASLHYPADFRAGVPGWFNLFLMKSADRSAAAFTDVTITITHNSQTFFTANLIKKVGIGTGGVITFADPGTYTLEVKFNAGATVIAETSYDLPVGQPPENSPSVFGIPLTRELGVGLLAGMGLALLGGRYMVAMRRQDETRLR